MRFVSFIHFSLEINKIACPFFNKTWLDAQQNIDNIYQLIILMHSSLLEQHYY